MLDTMNKLPSAKYLLFAALVLVVVAEQTMAANLQWQAAQGLWGKRSVPMPKMNEPMSKPAYAPQLDDAYNFMAKRAAQWQAANGLWGKRSDPQFQYPAFQYPQQA